MIGQRFGRWTVIESTTPYTWRTRVRDRFICRCDCGTVRAVIGTAMRNGSSHSCGCLTRERSRNKHTKHGRYQTPEYKVWQAMIARCFNPKNPRFDDYGERGISVCEEWRDFRAFHRDMGDRPSPIYSLDRIDNARGYEPGNCKWSLPHQQMTNRRCTRFVDVGDRKIPLADLAIKHKIPANTLRFRILKGWPLSEALNKPVRPKLPAAALAGACSSTDNSAKRRHGP